MPSVLPLDTADPQTLGPYRIVGRLGGAGRYLGESPGGDRVAVRRLDRPLDGPTRAKLARIREADAVGTAHLLDLGRDYLVTEYVDGPTLEEAVRERGPLTGGAPHRLGVALLTALAALHRAGLHHGGLRPGVVALGPMGPRLLGPDPTDTSAPRDDEGWSIPGEDLGPAADVFAWAALLAFSVTGRHPFGEAEKRVRYGSADLGPLDGELRAIVADCLAADPRERPGAEDALLRLLGHNGELETVIPDTLSPTRPVPARPHRPGWRGPAVAGTAIVAVFGLGGYLLTPAPAAVVSALPSASAPPAVSAAPAASATPTGAVEIALPDGAGTVFEDPADPVRLTSLTLGGADASSAYVRSADGAGFERVGGDHISAVLSPDGRYVAALDTLALTTTDRLSVAFTDRATGRRFSVLTVESPLNAIQPQWSGDSRRLLLTVLRFDSVADVFAVKGFMIIDVESRTPTFVETAGEEDVKAFIELPEKARRPFTYRWVPGDRSVASGYVTPEQAFGVTFRDLRGGELQSMHWVGQASGADSWYSPSGRAFFTTGCAKIEAACVWRAADGVRLATIPSRGARALIGWYDERHLIRGREHDGDRVSIEVVDFTGKSVRTLADVKSPGGLLDARFSRR